MMVKAKIITFVPRVGVEAKENVENFIKMCREDLTVFGKDLDWECNIWDLSKNIKKVGRKYRQVFSFVNFDTAGKKKGMVPMALPYLDFAKAYMRYGFGFNKNENHSQKLAAVRAIEKVLAKDALDGIPRIEKTTPNVFNKAAVALQVKNPGSAFQSGCHLEKIAKFICDNSMVVQRFSWANTIPKKKMKTFVLVRSLTKNA